MLTPHTQTPEVAQPTMGAHLLQPLQILTQLGLHVISEDLGVLAVGDIALSIEEPCWDFVLRRVLDDGDDSFEFLGRDLSGAIYI